MIGRVVLVGDDAAGPAQVGELDGVELAADLLADDRAAREDGEVAQHLLAAVAEAGGLDGEHVDDAAQLVDDERRERLAIDVLGDDEEVLLARLERPSRAPGRMSAMARDLLVGDEDVGLVEGGLHAARVGHEVGR